VHLTRREREISSYVVNGLSCKEIALRLNISHRTVELHRSRILRKLNVKNTAEMVSHIIMLERPLSSCAQDLALKRLSQKGRKACCCTVREIISH